MSGLEQVVRAVRPGVERLEVLAEGDDEVVLAGGAEVFRLPLSPEAVERHSVLVKALPVLRTRVPVAVAPPRYVGVLADGSTPFTAERRLPGGPVPALSGIAAAQLAGVVAALRAVPAKEARQWGVPGNGEVLVHGALATAALLGDGPRLTGIVGWRLRLATEDDALDPAVAALLD